MRLIMSYIAVFLLGGFYGAGVGVILGALVQLGGLLP